MFGAIFDERIKNLKERNLHRVVRDRESPQGRVIGIEGRTYCNFSSNDYLGLAHDERLTAAAVKALKDFGCGAGSSRLLSGGTCLHGELERAVARFKRRDDGLLFNSGYAVNIGVLPALALSGDVIFSDELNHASIIDGCRLSKARIYVYRHNDMEHLDSLLGSSSGGVKVVATESVFSMDGDVANLKELFKICKKHEALLYLDDAHATGVLGQGRGSVEHFGLAPDDFLIQMGTFSKALGSMGGFVAASGQIVDYLRNSARTFIYTTALPASVVAASLAALSIIEAGTELVCTLRDNSIQFREMLKRIGGNSEVGGETPIIPVVFSSVEETLQVAGRLWNEGIYAPAIRPPTVTMPRLRISLTALHTKEDLTLLASVLAGNGPAKEVSQCP